MAAIFLVLLCAINNIIKFAIWGLVEVGNRHLKILLCFSKAQKCKKKATINAYFCQSVTENQIHF